MSLGSHLDELRSRLIRAVVVPVLLSAGIFLVASHVRHFLTAPLVKALEATGQPTNLQVLSPTETLLVDMKAPKHYLPALIAALADAGCEVRGDAAVQRVDARVRQASEEDWYTEYLDAVIAVKVVDGVDAAIAHIARHSSSHTEAVVARDPAVQERFVAEVDLAGRSVRAHCVNNPVL